MNKTIKIIISVVLCVWIFAMGLELGAYRERKAINSALSNNPGVVNPTQSTTGGNIVINTPTTQAPDTTEKPTEKPTEAPVTEKKEDNTTEKEEKPTEKPASTVPQTTDEVVAAFVKAMNDTKHTTKNCKVVKNTDVKITVTNCSVAPLTGFVNSVVQGFTGPETVEYNFVGGKASGPDGEVTLYGDLPPSGRDVNIDAAGVVSASAEPYGNGGYKLTMTLIAEQSSLGNEPKYHANSVGYLDLDSLDISGVTITQADFNYPGATVTIAVNGDGLIDTYDCTLPMSGTGEGNIKVASASASLEGSSTESWAFTWG